MASPAFTKLITLPGSRYEMIGGRDLNRFARRELSTRGNVTFRTATVQQVLHGRKGARVVVDGRPIEAESVFDSTPEPLTDRRARRRKWGLAMQFKRWTIETRAATFGPQAATFLNFRTLQKHDARLLYVLPASEFRAMVLTVIISAAGLDRYSIVSEEAGSRARSDAISPRRLGQHVMAIGAKGGLVKPSTGFGFHRIQPDSAAIVRSLLLTGLPWNVPAVSERHRL